VARSTLEVAQRSIDPCMLYSVCVIACATSPRGVGWYLDPSFASSLYRI